jgi:hypothetical protein
VPPGEVIVAALGLLGSFGSVVSIITVLRYKTSASEELQKLKDKDLKEQKDKFEHLSTQVHVSIAKQALINKFITESLGCECAKKAVAAAIRK